MSTRRKLLLLAVCLLLGAAINVAVAWGCVIWTDQLARALNPKPLSDADRQALWSRHAQPDWPQLADSGVRTRSFGIVSDTAEASASRLVPGMRGEQSCEFSTTEFRCGWPSSALCSHLRSQTRTTTTSVDVTTASGDQWMVRPDIPILGIHSGQALPRKPIWPGLIVNTIFYAAIVWMVIRGPWETRRRWREWHARCGACGYPFGTSRVCTECGRPLPKQRAPAQKVGIV